MLRQIIQAVSTSPLDLLFMPPMRQASKLSLVNPRHSTDHADASEQPTPPVDSDPGTDQSDGQLSTDGHGGDLQDDQTIDNDLTVITCYIFAPEYVPVEIRVPLRLPATPEEFTAAVQNNRTGEDWPFFPQLCEVKPQPASTFACLLAVPTWPAAGVPVLIQLVGGGTSHLCHLWPSPDQP